MEITPRAQNLSPRQLRSSSPSYCWKTRTGKPNEMRLAMERKDWKGATCPVCLEHPHDAVLLLCTSHNKGCRPYMCGTNYHHSNCLEQFKEAYGKEKLTHDASSEAVPSLSSSSNTWPASKQPHAMELACPLCRGEVKGWTVVEPARQYLNRKRRTCMHDDCLFSGSYKELCKHVNAKHPSSKPCEVDPALANEWKKFESERERQDAISTIRATNPGAVIMGDYVIELNGNRNNNLYPDGDDFDLEERINFFTSLDGNSDESMDFYASSDGSLDESLGFLSSLFGSGRRILSRDPFHRANRRHRESLMGNYSTSSVGDSGIQHDLINSRRGQRIGVVQAIGRPRRYRHNVAQVRSTRGS